MTYLLLREIDNIASPKLSIVSDYRNIERLEVEERETDFWFWKQKIGFISIQQ